jgi:UDPglucose 6-dehydrogenase
MGKEVGSRMRIAEAVLEVNRKQKTQVVNKIDRYLEGLSDKTIGVWGLAFKPNTDDIRESPAISICQSLIEGHAALRVYDPVALQNAQSILNASTVRFCTDAYEAATEVDGLLICTEWNEFRNLNLEKVKSLMKMPILFDVRNIFEPSRMRKMGFRYFGIGR